MKKNLLKYIFPLLLISLFCQKSLGQIVSTDDFEDGSLTTGLSWTNGAAGFFLDDATSPVLAGSKSMRAVTNNTIKNVSISNSMNLNAATTTWRFLFKSSGAAANITTIPAPNNASWRFWVAASSTTTSSANGYAIIQQNNTLVFVRYDSGNLASTLRTYTMPNYTNTYSVKLVRNKSGLWSFYVAVGTGEPASTDLVSSATGDTQWFNTGTTVTINTLLEACDGSTTTPTKFVWDNFSISHPQLTVANNTNSVAGSSPIIFPNTGSYVIYSFQLTPSEDILLDYIEIGANGNMTGVFNNTTLKIYKSTDNVYDAGDTDYSTATYWGNGIINSGVLRFNKGAGVTVASGTSDYYFIVASTATTFSSYPSPVTLSVNSTVNNGNGLGGFIAHANTDFAINSYSFSSASPLTFGAYIDWTGNSNTLFANSGNWTPNLPGTTDVARIGVNTAITVNNQPTVSTAQTIGGLILGTKTQITLNVASTLTVNGDITQNSNWTGSGSGTYLVNTISGTGTISAVNLNVGDGSTPSLTSGANAGLYLNMSGGTINLSGAIKITSSVNSGGGIGPAAVILGAGTLNAPAITTTNASSGTSYFYMDFPPVFSGTGTLNLSGATPFTLAAGGTNYFNMGGGGSGGTNANVNFTGTSQSILLNLPQGAGTAYYDNIGFGGSGTKTFSGSGTLKADNGLKTIASSTPTVDFTTNNPTINVGSVTNVTGATIKQGSSPFTITGALNNAGTFTGGGGALSAASVTLTGGTFTTGSGAFSTSGLFDASGSSVINFGSGTVGVTNVFTLSTATLNFGTGTATFSNVARFQPGTVTGNSSGTVNYQSTLQNSSGGSYSAAGTINITGAFTNSATYTGNAANLTVTGDFTNSSTFTGSTGTMDFNGTNFTNSGLLTLPGGTTNIAATTVSNSGTLANTITASAGIVNFDRAGVQAINNSNTTSPITFNNVTFSGSGTKTLDASGTGKFTVLSFGTINVGSGITLANAVDNILTLKSTATGSAAVGVVAAGQITGKVNVERYITGGLLKYRGYRLISTPVSTVLSAGLINFADLNNVTNIAGLAAYTGGPNGGFTAVQSTPSIYLYDETAPASSTSFNSGKHKGLSKVTATTVDVFTGTTLTSPVTTSVYPGNGFIFYNIGPSTQLPVPTTTGTVPNAYTITQKGYLNQGNIAVKSWKSNSTTLSYTSALPAPGYHMVGNPYAAPIDLTQVFSGNPNIQPYVYELFNDNSAGQNYVAWNRAGQSDPSATGIIASGQGFIVRAVSSGGSLTFTESMKYSGTQPTAATFLSKAPIADNPTAGFYMKMELDSTDYDYCGVYFNKNYSDAYGESEDVIDIDGATPKVYMSSYTSDGRRTAINANFDYKGSLGKTVKLYVNAVADGSYKLKIEQIKNFDPLYEIWLMDSYKADSVNLNVAGVYKFDVTRNIAATFGSDRFKIVIRRKALPVYRFLTLAGGMAGNAINLSWKTVNEADYTGFTVERLNANKTYDPLTNIQSNGAGTYTYVDKNPIKGVNTYRIKQDDIDGKITYSADVSILDVNDNSANRKFTLYPNPIAATTLNVEFVNPFKGSVNITVSNANGTVMGEQVFTQQRGEIDVSKLKTGIYFIKAVSATTGVDVGSQEFIKL